MKLIFSFNFRLLVLVLLTHSVASVLAVAQVYEQQPRYQYKYIGRFEESSDTLNTPIPRNDAAQYWQDEGMTISREACTTGVYPIPIDGTVPVPSSESTLAGARWGTNTCGDEYPETFSCCRWLVKLAVNPSLSGYATQSNGVIPVGRSNATFQSRDMIIWPNTDFGPYFMEISGMALLSNGVYWTWAINAAEEFRARTEYTDNQFWCHSVWRQVGTDYTHVHDPNNTWGGMTTIGESSTAEQWANSSMVPKYNVLSTRNWDLSKVRGTEQSTFRWNDPTWIEIPMQTPFIFNPDSSFEMVIIRGKATNPPTLVNANGEVTAGQQLGIWAFSDDVPNNTKSWRSSFGIQYDTGSMNFGNNGGGFPNSSRPHLRLHYRYLSCENVTATIANNAYMTEATIPIADFGSSFEMRYAPEGAEHDIIYTIVGPAPYTDTMYVSNPVTINTEARGDDELRSYSSSLGDFANVTASGPAVAPDGQSVDCFKLEPGSYTLIASVGTKIDGFYPREGRTSFSISAGRDLQVYRVVEPAHQHKYVAGTTEPVRVTAEIFNNSPEDEPAVEEFYVRAHIYPMTYDSITNTYVRSDSVAIDTLPHKTADNDSGIYHWTAAKDNRGIPLASGGIIQLHYGQLSPGFPMEKLSAGFYDIEVEVWVEDVAWDRAPTNNIYPRGSWHHLIQIQREYDIVLDREQVAPVADFKTYLGNTVNVTTDLRNNGIYDVSDRSGYFLQTSIFRYDNTTKSKIGPPVWAPAPYVIRNASSNGEKVSVQCINDMTLAPIGWQANDTGSFIVETQLMLSNNAIPPVFVPVAGRLSTRIFTVIPGLAGSYTISTKYGANFITIKAALDTLYKRGVSGDVRFELPDTGYVESSWTAANVEYPALDFRGRIAGVCDTLHPAPNATSIRTRKIEFVPSGAVANRRGSVRIRLVSKSGYGMMFGTADNTVAHPIARINDAPIWEKKQWAKSDGNITWDGGVNQSFRLCLVPPSSSTGHVAADYGALDPLHAFRAPIYMSNAQNITISNCIIEENETLLPRSEYFLLPGNSYNMATLSVVPDYELSNVTTKAYSAGIVMRGVMPYQARYDGNYYEVDTMPCQNITLRNNDISLFSYGIVSIGLNYLSWNKGSLIDIVDTLNDLSIETLRTSNEYEDCLHAVEYPNVPAGGRTLVSWFKERVPSLERGTRYYKHHAVQQSGGAVSEYVQVIDSLVGGVARAFNRNGLIENNVIHNIGRAGIFLGNDENTIVRGNMITGITGRLKESAGRWGPVPTTGNIGSTYPASAYITDIDVAGILLGGNQRLHVTENGPVNGFMVVGTEIYKNEITSISGYSAVNGIKLEQSATNEGISALHTMFPDRSERIKIYSNMIWGLSSRDARTSRYGINLSLAKKNVVPGEALPTTDNMYYSTGNPNYFLDGMLVANNTIVLGEDGYYNSDGDYFGIRLQRIKNSRILNNAIELEDSTQFFASTNRNNFAALIYYQGPSPSELNNQIDYNAYGYKVQPSCAVDVYSHVLTGIDGSFIDVAHRGEYRNLSNWQNWLHNDFYSVVRNFSSELFPNQDYYPRLRFRPGTVLSNSPLDKRGIYLAEAQVDIDGVNRTATNQGFDIGAQYVTSAKLAHDVEVLTITSPATYKSATGPWSDAEYFMIPDAPITVRAKIRNNGSSVLQGKSIYLRVYEEPVRTNDSVANIHSNNHKNKYYDNELALHNEQYTFPTFDTAGVALFWEGTSNVILSPGEDTEVEFQLDKSFNSYYYLQGYTVPVQFESMIPNVTPRYLFVVSTDNEGDLDVRNNKVQKYARFYIKKSARNMLLSGVNSYHSMLVPQLDADSNTVLDKDGLPILEANSNIKNLDWVAGKLNLDTLQTGLNRLKYYQIDNEAAKFDFDILDRNAWDYRNIDYTLYQIVYVSDELDKNESRWTSSRYDKPLRLFREQYHAQNLLDFLQASTVSSKKNLVLASENYIKDIYKSLLQTKPFYILSDQAQRDAFLYDDNRRLAFVSPERRIAILRDSLQKVLVRDYFRADIVYDKLYENGPYLWNDVEYPYEYQPIYPLYKKGTVPNGGLFEPNWNYLPLPYRFSAKIGTLTGKSLNQSGRFEIKPTGWSWTQDEIVEDTPPYGAVFRPIDNFAGQLTIGAIYDTLTDNPAMSSTAPAAGKAAILCVNTIENNIVLIGLDWRHFGNIEVLLDNIMEYIVTNGGTGESPNLPISFYGFDAKAISNSAELFWNTSSGSVIDKFEVERADVVSEKIGNFNLIETISAKPATGDNFYNTTDKNLAFGSSFAYRLKLIDASGSFVYTDTKILNIEASQFSISDIVPNPVNSVSEFSINNQMDQNLHIAVYDMSGKEMFVINTGMLSSGVHNFKINSKDLPQATYSLTIRGEQQTIAKQFTVVR